MIGYTSVGTNDIARASAFYDELFRIVGGERMMSDDTFVVWSSETAAGGAFMVTLPFDQNSASVGNGVMVAVSVSSTEDVQRVYEKALEMGAVDEGPPGDRGGNFYAAYFRDLDGNKLNAFTWLEEPT
ncbi:MAG: VOC family protein [Pseudomonadota bacterium]